MELISDLIVDLALERLNDRGYNECHVCGAEEYLTFQFT